MSLFKKPGQSLIHVDFPLKIPRSTVFTVQGWIAGDRPIETLYAGKRQLELVRRPDVEAAHPDKEYVLGFQGIAGYDAVHEGHLVLEFSENRNRQTYHHELSPSPMLELSMEEKFKKFRTLFPAESPERLMTESRELEIDPDEATRERLKKRKVEKILGRLRCPGCMHSFEITDLPSDDFQCSVCNEHYQVRGTKIDFLNAHTRKEFNIEATANVATRGHDPLALAPMISVVG